LILVHVFEKGEQRQRSPAVDKEEALHGL
jgi:hypothetical protein